MFIITRQKDDSCFSSNKFFKKIAPSVTALDLSGFNADAVRGANDRSNIITAEYKDFLNASADSFFTILLLPAMHEGEKLVILQPISKNLFSKSSPIQEIFTNLYTGVIHKIKLVHHALHEQKKVINNTVRVFSPRCRFFVFFNKRFTGEFK